ncbi:hypothetical protein AYI70_g8697 [Smittium culicis]|uniref:Uncharacterized protein n=1 Tax=Smittium culicis TaxID=133412 RepID=A0A1R1XER9_9FUNG|nr:hypothetical protein AYI70_g8697 [Smittium culicis]
MFNSQESPTASKSITFQPQILSIQRYLHELAREHNSTIIVINSAVFDGNYEDRQESLPKYEPQTNIGDIISSNSQKTDALISELGFKPALGLNWTYVCHHRIFLSQQQLNANKNIPHNHRIAQEAEFRAVLTRSINLSL